MTRSSSTPADSTAPCAALAVPVGSAWTVRFLEGMSRGQYGLFIDQSSRPILKSKKEHELQNVADAHNATLTPNTKFRDGEDRRSHSP